METSIENMDIIMQFRLLAKKLQSDDRLIYLEQAKKMNDMDEELQDLIGKLNVCQMNYRVEAVKEDKDEDKINAYYEEYMYLYNQIMANESMASYNQCKTEADNLRTFINAIIDAAFDGGDPMLVEMPATGCSGDCSGCS